MRSVNANASAGQRRRPSSAGCPLAVSQTEPRVASAGPWNRSPGAATALSSDKTWRPFVVGGAGSPFRSRRQLGPACPSHGVRASVARRHAPEAAHRWRRPIRTPPTGASLCSRDATLTVSPTTAYVRYSRPPRLAHESVAAVHSDPELGPVGMAGGEELHLALQLQRGAGGAGGVIGSSPRPLNVAMIASPMNFSTSPPKPSEISGVANPVVAAEHRGGLGG